MFSLTFEGLVFPITLNMAFIRITRYRKYVEHTKKTERSAQKTCFSTCDEKRFSWPNWLPICVPIWWAENFCYLSFVLFMITEGVTNSRGIFSKSFPTLESRVNGGTPWARLKALWRVNIAFWNPSTPPWVRGLYIRLIDCGGILIYISTSPSASASTSAW